MLVMLLLVFSTSLLQNVMDLLADGMDSFNKSSGLINLNLNMGRFLVVKESFLWLGFKRPSTYSG